MLNSISERAAAIVEELDLMFENRIIGKKLQNGATVDGKKKCKDNLLLYCVRRRLHAVFPTQCWMVGATRYAGAIPVWLDGPKSLMLIA